MPINFNKLEQKLKKATEKKYTLFVGWTDPELSKIAAIQEYGAHISVTDKMRGFLAAAYGIYLKSSTTVITIPPRPHRKQTTEKYMQKWKKELSKLLVKTGFDIEKSLKTLGLIAEQNYKSVLKSGEFVQLAVATMHIRKANNIGGSQPLHATGELGRRVTSEVTQR